jgi:hypothetical protein
VQIIDNPLNVLAISAEVPSEPRDRLRAFGGDDGAEDLPAGACQPKPRDQTVARGQKHMRETKRTLAGDALTSIMLDLFRLNSLAQCATFS